MFVWRPLNINVNLARNHFGGRPITLLIAVQQISDALFQYSGANADEIIRFINENKTWNKLTDSGKCNHHK